MRCQDLMVVFNNIATVLVGPQNVSITEVKNLGLDIMSKMATTSPCTYTFKKNMQAVPIPSKQQQSKPNHIHILVHFSENWINVFEFSTRFLRVSTPPAVPLMIVVF